MTRRSLTVVPDSDHATPAVVPSFGNLSGVSRDMARPIDLHAIRRTCPDNWRAFLHAHYRSPTEVAYFYDVTDRAARDWWEGRSAPRMAAVITAARREPAGFQAYLVDAA